jgi:hypothetical protein
VVPSLAKSAKMGQPATHPRPPYCCSLTRPSALQDSAVLGAAPTISFSIALITLWDIGAAGRMSPY